MRPFKLAVLLLVAFLLSALATLLYYSFYYVVDVKETHMKLLVADFGGFDLNPVNLTFGAASPGDAANRAMTIRNVYGRPVRARIILSGDLAPMVSLTDHDFVLQRNEERIVTASAAIPEDAAINVTHYGKVRVVFTRVW
jgi:hypothetical protein